jgi:hypothetical protein
MDGLLVLDSTSTNAAGNDNNENVADGDNTYTTICACLHNDDGTIATYSDIGDNDDTLLEEEGHSTIDDDGTMTYNTITCGGGEDTTTVYSESICTYESITNIGIVVSRFRRLFLSKKNHKLIVDMIPTMISGVGMESHRQRRYKEFLVQERNNRNQKKKKIDEGIHPQLPQKKTVNFANHVSTTTMLGCCHTGFSSTIAESGDDDDDGRMGHDDIRDIDNDDDAKNNQAIVTNNDVATLLPSSSSLSSSFVGRRRGDKSKINDEIVNDDDGNNYNYDDNESNHNHAVVESFWGSILECCTATSMNSAKFDPFSLNDHSVVLDDMTTIRTNPMENKKASLTTTEYKLHKEHPSPMTNFFSSIFMISKRTDTEQDQNTGRTKFWADNGNSTEQQQQRSMKTTYYHNTYSTDRHVGTVLPRLWENWNANGTKASGTDQPSTGYSRTNRPPLSTTRERQSGHNSGGSGSSSTSTSTSSTNDSTYGDNSPVGVASFLEKQNRYYRPLESVRLPSSMAEI